MTDLITFIENNENLTVYTGGNIHELYCYLEMIGTQAILTTSGQRSHNFGPSYYTKNDTANIQPVIAAFHIRQKSI